MLADAHISSLGYLWRVKPRTNGRDIIAREQLQLQLHSMLRSFAHAFAFCWVLLRKV